jgi:hypothetical protein
MKKTKKTTTQITIETERLLVVGRRNVESWCPACGALVQRLTVDEAAADARVDLLTVRHWVEAGTIHFAETETGEPLICAVSLGKKQFSVLSSQFSDQQPTAADGDTKER